LEQRARRPHRLEGGLEEAHHLVAVAVQVLPLELLDDAAGEVAEALERGDDVLRLAGAGLEAVGIDDVDVEEAPDHAELLFDLLIAADLVLDDGHQPRLLARRRRRGGALRRLQVETQRHAVGELDLVSGLQGHARLHPGFVPGWSSLPPAGSCVP
jgi:hypothetical protein